MEQQNFGFFHIKLHQLSAMKREELRNYQIENFFVFVSDIVT